MALLMTAVLTIVVWLLCGLIAQQWWIEFACFAATTYLMVILNNDNALVRIYSRMVSCSFMVLSCAACYLFQDLRGGFVQLCVVAAYLLLFNCYQDKQSPGRMYYTFLCLGLASCTFVQILYLVPFLWLFIAVHLNAMSLRNFLASLLGLLTPYWLVAAGLFFWQGKVDILTVHFAELVKFQGLDDYYLSPSQLMVIIIIAILAVTGIIHYLRTSYNDKIRIQQLYRFFMTMAVITAIFLLLQPQHENVLTRLLIVNTAPLIGHFIALTHTKWTNMAFYAIVAACLFVIAFNVWTLS